MRKIINLNYGMRFKRRVAANGTKAPPPSPSPFADLALRRSRPRPHPRTRPLSHVPPAPNVRGAHSPARYCYHRPSSVSPQASDAERPSSPLATSSPARL